MATRRPAANFLIVLVVLGAGAILYRRLAPRARQLGAQITEQTRTLTADTESINDAAVQQRFRARRAAVAAMMADLRRLVVAESTTVADTGYALPNPRSWTGPSPGNVGPYIHLSRNGWWAAMSNTLTGIHCAVQVGDDTTFGSAKSGEPWCFGGKDWTAVQ